MEALKKKKGALRTGVTKAVNAFNTQLNTDDSAIAELTVSFGVLQAKYALLEKIAEELIDAMMNSNAPEAAIVKESDDDEEYHRKYLMAKYKFDSLIALRNQAVDRNAAPSRASSVPANETRKTYNLPTIDFFKFSGNVRDWLEFWSRFKKIDEDPAISNEDKFQYLIQAMVPDSRAEVLVKSYPPTGGNYSKAIEALKKRFGRSGLQIEVYVRELLQLVLQNATSSKAIPLALLYDKIESHLRALETLGMTSDKYAALLFPLVESSLPEELLRTWQRLNIVDEDNARASTSTDAETDEFKTRLKKLIRFLEREVEGEVKITMAKNGFGIKEHNDTDRAKTSKTPSAKKDVPTASSLLSKNEEITCVFCTKEHESAKCTKAKDMLYAEKKELATKRRACFKCLRVGHISAKCRVNVKCGKCSRRHVEIMCFKDEKEKNSDSAEKTVTTVCVQPALDLATSSRTPTTFMQTLKIKLRGDSSEITVRALIDSGSQNSYVLRDVVDRLGYQPVGYQDMVHLLFGGNKSRVTSHGKYLIQAGDISGSFWCDLQVLDQATICTNVPSVSPGTWIEELASERIKLSDVSSNEKAVSVLIGADIAGQLLTGKIHNLKSGLTAVETRLGWTLMGKVPVINEEDTSLAVSAITMFVREAEIADLWSLDSIGIRDPIESRLKEEHQQVVMKALIDNVAVNAEGRYEVKLPWLENHPALCDNKEMAIKRLQLAKDKLRAEQLYEDYDAVFEGWLAEGVIERVPLEEEKHWGRYLPHRPVLKQDSTTAIRPVFDASAKTKGSPSINECVEKGPNLIELVTTCLQHFREGNIGVVADIKKAFLQISVHESERDFLRFLWFDKDGRIIIFRHCRVVFGVSCSPFVLSAVLNLHIENAIESCENVQSDKTLRENLMRLRKSFYVDNCITSVNDIEQLDTFIRDAKAVMSTASFDLRGWEHTHDGSDKTLSNVLGITWDKQNDTLSLKVSFEEPIEQEKITKKRILSVTHRIFDPLGFAAPVSVIPRTLLQEICKARKLSWDDEVDDDIKVKFVKWAKELKDLHDIKIPRKLFGDIDNSANVTLHTFCDASKVAYAAVIFLRVETAENVELRFVQAKTRVAPIKPMNSDARASIPRLELLAATIGTRLTASVLETYKHREIKTYYWSDSSTVLTWIRKENNWSTFVWNRVKEIGNLSLPEQWRHVPGHKNPADLPSRGCTVKQLINSRWWEGPDWLKLKSENWPADIIVGEDEEANKELKKSAKIHNVCNLIACEKEPWLSNFSNYGKTKRVLAWVNRFCNNAKIPVKNQGKNQKLSATAPLKRLKGELLYSEIRKAETLLLKTAQSEFDGTSDNRIKHLQPFKDSNGIIRLKSKITERNDTYDFLCPVILPCNNDLVTSIIRDKHIDMKHAGSQILLNALRENFWIIKGRKTVRAVINKCTDCRRHDAAPLDTQPAPLPLNRVRDAAVFEVVGVDFAGPLYLKGGQKAWVCIFTCAVFRAVNLELVTSLSTATFIMALQRHIARYGRPSVVYSDNGTNFVGLNNLLKKLNFEKIASIVAMHRIEWKFNPPTAAWWGGFWERLIGVLKRLLRRTLKKSCLCYEEMSTVLTDCQAVINARPLTFMSDHAQEMVPLTPSMFIQDVKEIGVLDLDHIEISNLEKRYAYRQKIKRALRSRFRTEYLGSLMFHKKRVDKNSDINVNDIVLVHNENAKRVDWPLARVTELIVGKDGCVRTVRLRTTNGEILRPIQRLIPLECQTGSPQENDLILNNCKTTELKANCNKQCKTGEELHVVTRSGRKVTQPDRLNYH